jgi:peptidyl-prolyl cis-trans isomerase SurA
MKYLIPSLTLALFLVSTGAQAQTQELSTRGQQLDKIAAVVNEGVVLRSQVDQQYAAVVSRLQAQEGQMPPAQVIRQQVLERLVLQEIQAQRAERLGIVVSDEMLNTALRDVDYAAYREDMRREIALSLLRQRDVLARIYVSPRELDQALERQAVKPDDNVEYDVSHILLSLPESATAEQMTQVEQRAQEIQQRAIAGEDFGQLAITYSQAQSALDRGKLGWRRVAQLPQFIADEIVKLEPGQVTPPLRTPTGFHIVKLDAVRGGDGPMVVEQVHARHILLRPTEVQDDATTRQRLDDLRDRIVAGEDFAALASITSEDPGSAAQGGDLGWAAPGTFVPEFDEALAALEENEISEPFRTQYGWHIVQLLGKRFHDQSDEVRRQRVLTALRESKVDEETELWLRRLRDEAYVEYRSM